MENGIQLLIVKEHKLVVQRATGIIGRDVFINMLTELYSMTDYLDTSLILTDLRESKAECTVDEVEEVTQFIIEHNHNTDGLRNAILTNEPSLTAVSILYQHYSTCLPNYSSGVFSELANALFYLQVPKYVVDEAYKQLDSNKNSVI